MVGEGLIVGAGVQRKLTNLGRDGGFRGVEDGALRRGGGLDPDGADVCGAVLEGAPVVILQLTAAPDCIILIGERGE